MASLSNIGNLHAFVSMSSGIRCINGKKIAAPERDTFY